ncbi:phomenoic acid biosynthesis cluster MFS-type transporter [Physcia stellaris]|nr:phomenoic acid biosynthesis cluster MFS-type transporter [Physcia stellaris]
MASYLITGANRGFGLALARQLISLPASEVAKVFATARSDAPELVELAKKSSDRVVIVNLDVTNEASIKQAAAEVEADLSGKGLDVLINNAGVCQYASDGVKSMDNLAESFTINVLGVHWVTRAFLPLLYKGTQKKVVNIPSSTTLGSITLSRAAHYLPAPAYKISKAAMNALTVQYALDYEKEGFTFMALSPGWMKTDLGGGDMADLTPDEGARASLDIIFKPGQELNGQFPKVLVKGWEKAEGNNQYDGSIPPW